MSEVETVTETVKKPRKPRSPNKPKTPEKLGYAVSKKVDTLNRKCDEAIEAAIARVKLSFKDKVNDLLESLPPDVIPFVTGVRSNQEPESEVENPDVSEIDQVEECS